MPVYKTGGVYQLPRVRSDTLRSAPLCTGRLSYSEIVDGTRHVFNYFRLSYI
jgi:hypothetical protein